MAIYQGPGGEVDAEQLAEDQTFQPSGQVGKKGEWVILCADGLKRLCDDAGFRANFRQKYPRPVGRDRIDVTPDERRAS